MHLLVMLASFLEFSLTVGELVDWVHPDYAISPASRTATTSSSRQRIASRQDSSVKKGTWSVTASNIVPPSKNTHDYLSWAPYHWPNCNWCKNNSKQGSASFRDPSTPSEDDSGIGDGACFSDGADYADGPQPLGDRPAQASACNQGDSGNLTDNVPRQLWDPEFIILDDESEGSLPTLLATPTPTAAPTAIADATSLQDVATSTTTEHIASQNPSAAGAIQKSKTAKSTCTPSPTKSIPPSATWTTCPYKVRDGKANPDVRSIPNIDSLNKVTQATISNALAYVLTNSDEAASRFVEVLSAWFIQNTTAMSPHVNFGQVIRGPGKQSGGYTGIVDFRNLVNVANAIAMMRATKSSRWTSSLNSAMITWSKAYVSWLEKGEQGQKVASSPNNHVSFYYAQLTALYILIGDENNAKRTLKQYFTGPYQEQITAAGEQPLEAVRTRPWHYRCFNMEAMLANAKLADYLGQDYWTTATKYGGSIKKALDFIIKLDPGEEDVTSVVPHVAAVAAAFGDPKGVYDKYLKSKQSNYDTEVFWFYDQPGAFKLSPAAKSHSRRADAIGVTDTDGEIPYVDDEETPEAEGGEIQGLPPVNASTEDCPPVFKGRSFLQLDLDVYVTCDVLRPFYVPVP